MFPSILPRVLSTDSRSAFHSFRRSLNDELVNVDPLSVRRRSTRTPGAIDVANDRLTGVRKEDGTERFIRNRWTTRGFVVSVDFVVFSIF